MIRRPPRSTHCISSAASDVYKRQFISKVNIRHREKIAKADLVREIDLGEVQSEILRRWKDLKMSIRSERDQFLQEAEEMLLARKEDGSAH